MMALFKRVNKKHYKMSEKIKIVSKYLKDNIDVPHPLEGLIYNYENIMITKNTDNCLNDKKQQNGDEYNTVIEIRDIQKDGRPYND
jgi:hypothetical protein